VVPNEIMTKIQIFNNLLLEKTLPLYEKSRILLEYSRTVDPNLLESDSNLRKNSSFSTNFSISGDKKWLKPSEIDNNGSSSHLSHETFTIESEKESYFSKPLTVGEEKPELNQEKTNELFIKISHLLSQKTIENEEKIVPDVRKS